MQPLDTLKKHSPAFGYHPTTCHIITKERLFEKAQRIFVHNQEEKIDGCSVLGSVIASDNAEKKFLERSLKQQKLSLKKLGDHAYVSPQSVFNPFISLVQRKLTFLACTTPNIEDLLEECEKSKLNSILRKLTISSFVKSLIPISARR